MRKIKLSAIKAWEVVASFLFLVGSLVWYPFPLWGTMTFVLGSCIFSLTGFAIPIYFTDFGYHAPMASVLKPTQKHLVCLIPRLEVLSSCIQIVGSVAFIAGCLMTLFEDWQIESAQCYLIGGLGFLFQGILAFTIQGSWAASLRIPVCPQPGRPATLLVTIGSLCFIMGALLSFNPPDNTDVAILLAYVIGSICYIPGSLLEFSVVLNDAQY